MNWQTKLKQALPLLGHRNWIVIADAAYPWQTAAGIETIATGGSQLEVTKQVLAALGKTTHVQPIIYTDAELEYVAETDAPGVTAYRKQLTKLLAKCDVQVLPHEEIIKKLDVAGQTFHVLLLNPPTTNCCHLDIPVEPDVYRCATP